MEKQTLGLKRSICPIANTLDLVGDKWTLLILRDVLNGLRRYKDFQNSPEKIPTNILANRLKRLELAGILRKTQYQDRPPRFEYKATRKGVELLPVIQEMARWGNKHIEGTVKIPEELLNIKL